MSSHGSTVRSGWSGGCPGSANVTRLLAVPVEAPGRRVVVVVGASMQDRADTLRLVVGFLGAAEPLALLVACLAGGG
jgi:hypothetical protein